MDLIKIYAEIQRNPNNIAAYRQLIEYYKNTEYAEAFNYLIQVKFGHYNTNSNQ
jgi:hypothetical protein